MNLLQLMGSLELGLIYGLVALGVYLTFKVIRFADLSVDGSFPLGAGLTASLILGGYSPWIATLAAVVAGGLAGYVTGVLHVRLKILDLLAGILTMSALYSINLRLMGRPNLALLDEPTLFGSGEYLLIITLVVLGAIAGLVWRFLTSEYGLSLRAVGINPRSSKAYGIDVNSRKIVALSCSNAIIALAGSLFAQSQGFADISMGTGTLVIGLASVIIGQTLMSSKRLSMGLLSVVLGSILYRLVVALALNASFIGLKPTDLNLITALLVVLAIIPTLKTSQETK